MVVVLYICSYIRTYARTHRNSTIKKKELNKHSYCNKRIRLVTRATASNATPKATKYESNRCMSVIRRLCSSQEILMPVLSRSQLSVPQISYLQDVGKVWRCRISSAVGARLQTTQNRVWPIERSSLLGVWCGD